MYKSLSIKKFRGIENLDVEDFKRINLFVGKNNSGKTTLLESLFCITGPTNPELPIKTNLFRNFEFINENSWSFFFNNAQTDSEIEFFAELDHPQERRTLKIKPNTNHREQLGKSVVENGSIELKSSLTKTSDRINGLVLEFIQTRVGKKQSKYLSHAIVKESGIIEYKRPKDYQEALRGIFLKSNSLPLELDRRFDKIQVNKQVNRIVDILKVIEPNIVGLVLGADKILYCDVGLNKLIPINFVGDGMFRVLSIILAIFDAPNGVVFIDEVENGFHYSSQEMLWKSIFGVAKELNVQVFATTHSWECVKAFSNCYEALENKDNFNIKLFRMEKRQKKTNLISYDHTMLKDSIESGWEVR